MSTTNMMDRREINEARELLAISYVRGEIELHDYEVRDDSLLALLFADDDANGKNYAMSLTDDLKTMQAVLRTDDTGRRRTTNQYRRAAK